MAEAKKRECNDGICISGCLCVCVASIQRLILFSPWQPFNAVFFCLLSFPRTVHKIDWCAFHAHFSSRFHSVLLPLACYISNFERVPRTLCVRISCFLRKSVYILYVIFMCWVAPKFKIGFWNTSYRVDIIWLHEIYQICAGHNKKTTEKRDEWFNLIVFMALLSLDTFYHWHKFSFMKIEQCTQKRKQSRLRFFEPNI